MAKRDPRELVPITVELFVPDVEGSVRFYAEKLPPGGGAIDIRIVVEDVDAVYQRALDHGVEVVRPLADRDHGLRDFIVRDPDGFRLRFASALR